jgi:hypothetical protein
VDAPTELKRRAVLIVGALIVVRVAALFVGIATLPAGTRAGHGLGNDATRFHQIATSLGRPYRDVENELPPVALGAIHAIDGSTSGDLARRLAFLMFACDLAIAAALWGSWGLRVAIVYLVIGTPLSTFMYFRLDLLSVLLAVGAIALVRRGRQWAAAGLLIAAIFTKVWPAVLVQVPAAQRRLRAFFLTIAGSVVGWAAWVAWVGLAGPTQVLTFRYATGWEETSEVGFILRRTTSMPLRFQAGAYRIGTDPPAVQVALVGLAVVALLWIYMHAQGRDPSIIEGVAPVASVAVLLVLSPLLSSQFICWLLPWVAIAQKDRLEGWFAAVVLGAAAISIPVSVPTSVHVVGEFVRNAALIGLAISALRILGSSDAAVESSPDPPALTVR